jgi:hypothetical protein
MTVFYTAAPARRSPRLPLLAAFTVLAGTYLALDHWANQIEADKQKTYKAGISYVSRTGEVKALVSQGQGEGSCMSFFLRFKQQTDYDRNPVGTCLDTSTDAAPEFVNLKNRVGGVSEDDKRVRALKAKLEALSAN